MFAVRSHEEMKEVLMDPIAIGPDVHYYMIRGGKDKTNVTIWETGKVGGEFIKTYGHYHVGNTKEVYLIVSGEGIVLLQQRKKEDNIPIDNKIEIFIAIKVKVGDEINMPPDIGHLVVNTGNKWLITIDNSPLRTSDIVGKPSHADYGPIKKMHGFAYYIIEKNGKLEFIKNGNYEVVPKVKWLTPEEWRHEKGFENDVQMYNM